MKIDVDEWQKKAAAGEITGVMTAAVPHANISVISRPRQPSSPFVDVDLAFLDRETRVAVNRSNESRVIPGSSESRQPGRDQARRNAAAEHEELGSCRPSLST